MNFHIRIGVLGALLSSVPAYASDWQYVTSSQDDMEVYVDRDSWKPVKVISQTYVSAWVKWVFSKPESDRSKEIKILFYFDCEGSRSAIMASIRYDAAGDVLGNSSSAYPKWTPDAPDTIGYSTQNTVCSWNS